jgi:hypothetical protein
MIHIMITKSEEKTPKLVNNDNLPELPDRLLPAPARI